MPLTFNLRHLREKNLRLRGELPVAELDLAGLDELIHARHPLSYDLEVEEVEDAILVRGTLELPLDCECVRCLKPFRHLLRLEDWACHLALTGEDKVPMDNDCVDLTPYLREDSVLAFPRHPLCETECGGLKTPPPSPSKPGGKSESTATSSAWGELDKLKLT